MPQSKTAIATNRAPAAIGPYSQGIDVGPLVFLSGQLPLDLKNGMIVEGGIEAQIKCVLSNLNGVLAAAGLDFSHVVKTTVFLASMDDFPIVNRVYAETFTGAALPARSTVQAARLPKDALVEIECIAWRDGFGSQS
ncbi:RidA family protein [Paenibacillaceae bacterium WGS1546]|uniref:RidA family protein n=1 Tax=Cohnella sp. WGS1546 TaxID=3366810 RepID=UPI00372D4189